jgi:hypothetical protein
MTIDTRPIGLRNPITGSFCGWWRAVCVEKGLNGREETLSRLLGKSRKYKIRCDLVPSKWCSNEVNHTFIMSTSLWLFHNERDTFMVSNRLSYLEAIVPLQNRRRRSSKTGPSTLPYAKLCFSLYLSLFKLPATIGNKTFCFSW